MLTASELSNVARHGAKAITA
jgi:hypothetical protein